MKSDFSNIRLEKKRSMLLFILCFLATVWTLKQGLRIPIRNFPEGRIRLMYLSDFGIDSDPEKKQDSGLTMKRCRSEQQQQRQQSPLLPSRPTGHGRFVLSES